MFGYRVLGMFSQARHGWMSADSVQEKTLFELCLPGSHNSHSYRFDESNDDSSKLMKWFKSIIGWSKKQLKGAILCQQKSIQDQLNDGIRALDIRAIHDGKTAHGGWECIGLDWGFSDIFNFLYKNPKEVVCVRIAVDKPLNNELVRQWIGSKMEDVKKVVKAALTHASKLKNDGRSVNDDGSANDISFIDLSDAKECTVKELVEENSRVVLMFDETQEEGNSTPEHLQSMYSKTKDKSPEKLLEKIKTVSQERYGETNDSYEVNDEVLRWLDLQVTDPADAMKNTYAPASKKVAVEAMKPLNLERIMVAYPGLEQNRKVFNFIGMDYVGVSKESLALIDKIISANKAPQTRDPYDRTNSFYIESPNNELKTICAKDPQADKFKECGQCFSDITVKRSFGDSNSKCATKNCTGRCTEVPPEWLLSSRRRLPMIQKRPMAQLLSQTS